MSYTEMIIEVECALDEAGISATKEQIELVATSIQDGMENHGMGAPDYPNTILKSEYHSAIQSKDYDIEQLEKSYEEKIRDLKWKISDLETTICSLQRQSRDNY